MSTSNIEPVVSKVMSVRELPFDRMGIPEYQRPYKWTVKNVNQLINDIITFRKKSRYRLGTLVLFKNDKDVEEIVDGQQRIVTLVLLLKKMYECLNDEKVKNSYYDIKNGVDSFAKKIKFHNKYSLHNVVENALAIENRKNDFDYELYEFVLSKCEFVVVTLNDISEAFQFFDSQNARGKDLEAHDLLKAYHLREITTLNESDSANIDEWQNTSTDDLKFIFLTLFRAKSWSKGKSARFFTKNDINVFKGVSINGGKRYPYYQMEIIAHIFSDMYNNDKSRLIDGQHIDYPFNLDDQIINGSRFFDLIHHYLQLYNRIKKYKDSLAEGSKAKEILNLIHNYGGMWRTGDGYIRDMFYTLLIYYVDRFGEEELDKIVPQFFLWAYRLRLQNQAIYLATVDNYSIGNESMFKTIYNSQTPYEIINLNIDGVNAKDLKCSKCERIVNQFGELNKYYGNE